MNVLVAKHIGDFFFLIDIYLHGKNREIIKSYERLL